jgi:multidrug resistance efflux pump
MPKFTLADLGRFAVTLIFVVIAAFAGHRLWSHYQRDPWTRDGRVRADVVQLAPDVSGLVTRVSVSNDQVVQRGDVLFEVDRDRYALALRQADAAVAAARTQLVEARREYARNLGLGDLVAAEVTEQSQSRVEQGEAQLAQAQAARDVAALNLERTVVRAPVDGFMSDLTLRSGDYVAAGRPVVALIDRRSFRVEGYFEETKLPRLAIGQPVQVKIMGEPHALRGHIVSIAAGIEDRDRTSGQNLLPSVNPTFSWVRLAQRVPVRIMLDETPADLRLIAGRTATVSVMQGAAPVRSPPVRSAAVRSAPGRTAPATPPPASPPVRGAVQ